MGESSALGSLGFIEFLALQVQDLGSLGVRV